MTDRYELSRRKTLAGLATIGAAGAGAGLGTTALFSDTETLQGEIQAGSLDLEVTAEVVETVDNDYWDGLTLDATAADGDVRVAIDVGDVKPGDWAILAFDVVVTGNPAYVQTRAGELMSYENGLTDPEAGVDDTGGDPGEESGELHTAMLAEAYRTFEEASDGNPPRSYLSDGFGGDLATQRSTVGETYDDFEGGELLRDADDTPTEVGTTGSTWYLLFLLPSDVGNVVQTDSIEFDLRFEAEQVRNNDNPFNSTG